VSGVAVRRLKTTAKLGYNREGAKSAKADAKRKKNLPWPGPSEE
jgi:hypothetical protein